MAELTVKDVEVVRDIPGNPPEKGGPAKILKVSFEENDRQPELFVTARTSIPSPGEKIPEERLTFNQQWNRWEFVKQQPSGGGGGSFKRDPKESKAIQRQHSQEMMLRLQALRGAQWTGDEMRSVTNWFEQDIAGKDRAVTWDGLSDDVPADMSGTPFEEPNA